MLTPRILTGVVVHGYGRGSKQLGFPTANLHGQSLPEEDFGVYAGYTSVGSKKDLPSVISIGKNPTFNEKEPTVEVHILDFDEDIYGEQITCKLVSYIRPMVSFKSINELIDSINSDIRMARELL